MYKLVDSTFVFAMRNDIKSVELLPRFCSRYELITTDEIRSEAVKTPFPEEYIAVKSFPSDDYEKLKETIFRRHPQLHKGEISAIAASILLTEEGFDNYIVTDDNRARKSIDRLESDQMFWNTINHSPVKLKYAGTIGIIQKLKSYGIVSLDECKSISRDLQNSSFRAPEHLLKILCD